MAVAHSKLKHHRLEVWPNGKFCKRNAFEAWCAEHLSSLRGDINIFGGTLNPTTGKAQARYVFYVTDLDDVTLVKLVHS